MNIEAVNILDTVAKRDHLKLRVDSKLNYKKIADMVELSKPDLSGMIDIKIARIRFDKQIPRPLRKRLEEIGNILNLVGGYFDGDVYRTALWFSTKNPGLGNISPRNMIRMNRHNNLRNFILAAREEHGWEDNNNQET